MNMSDAQPKELATLTGGASAAGGPVRPSGGPPVRTGGGAATVAAGTVWNNGQIVNALWSINQDKNAWMGIAGVGWQKLSNASETGLMSLNLLASHAKQLQTQINYRTESDGMVHEIYAW
jgi:hypothetical protein